MTVTGRWRRAVVAVAVLGVLALAVAGLLRATGVAGAPSRADRVAAVASTLRCPTCAGLSVEDSTSTLAQASRRVIEQQLAAGRSPDQVRQYFADRYGDWVLLSPDPAGPGLVAWLLPGLAVLAAGAGAWRWLRRSRRIGRLDDGADAAAEEDDDPLAPAALARYRTGELDPDGSPAGDALRAALEARVAVAEDADVADPAEVARADRRLAVAYRRWSARPAAVEPAPRPARSGPALPRRAVTLGAVAVVGAAAVAVAVLTAGAGGTGSAGGSSTPAVQAAAASSAASTAPGAPSAPPGWTGGMPQNEADWVALGRAYDKAGQPSQAVAAYDQALRLQPAADDVSLLRADVLVRAGRPADALPALTELQARYPDNADVLLVLGLAQRGTGAPQAADTLRRFLTLSPNSPAAPGVRKLLGEG